MNKPVIFICSRTEKQILKNYLMNLTLSANRFPPPSVFGQFKRACLIFTYLSTGGRLLISKSNILAVSVRWSESGFTLKEMHWFLL